jgi:23S rRNA (guanosine2251-2'-O)-methyltransferase
MRYAKAPPQRGKPRAETGRVVLFGLHAVEAALRNKKREIHRVLATENAAQRLEAALSERRVKVQDASPRDLDRMLGSLGVGDPVHQGVVLETAPLPPVEIEEIALGGIVIVLDQVTDPHNVGAILRSAAALGADGVVTTFRHQPGESGALAKAASGALDLIPFVHVGNLAQSLVKLRDFGFTLIGLDSEGAETLERAVAGDRIGLVLGAEGKGLRHLTRERCDVVARLDMPGPIKSLNVSNAAAISLYLARKVLDAKRG